MHVLYSPLYALLLLSNVVSQVHDCYFCDEYSPNHSDFRCVQIFDTVASIKQVKKVDFSCLLTCDKRGAVTYRGDSGAAAATGGALPPPVISGAAGKVSLRLPLPPRASRRVP